MTPLFWLLAAMPKPDVKLRILTVIIQSVEDVVAVRQRAREISKLLGFGAQDQVRIATGVSEVARFACSRTAVGKAVFEYGEDGPSGCLIVRITGNEREPAGIAEPGEDWGQAIDSARRLMNDCEVEPQIKGGIRITLRKLLPSSQKLTDSQFAMLASQLAARPAGNSFSELQQQNHELLELLAQLKEREEDLLTLTQELEDTNRGVVALYAEIEEKAKRIQRADEMKSRFLSNTSHELRTPLGAIRAISELLLARMDGDLSYEQERQVRFIEKAASDLSELVNDLLDLAKIEAGKVEIHNSAVSIHNLFSGLKGMLRPLASNPSVELVFQLPEINFELNTDEGKVTQILRNFMTNALKFTEQGQVCLSAIRQQTGRVRFEVSDTGIGIAPENLQLIFEEFSQIENPRQRIYKGTGLGLPLCQKLAMLLKGEIAVTSVPGIGSTFSLELPQYHFDQDSGISSIFIAESFCAENTLDT